MARSRAFGTTVEATRAGLLGKQDQLGSLFPEYQTCAQPRCQDGSAHTRIPLGVVHREEVQLKNTPSQHLVRPRLCVYAGPEQI